MGWTDNIVDLAVAGLPGIAAALVPAHLKNQWRERLDDHNPFKTISANHDLVRATRLAWIEAAQEILKEASKASAHPEFGPQTQVIRTFHAIVTEHLLDIRDHALDRRKDPGPSPIDAHLEAVINGVPELVSPGAHVGIGSSVTAGFEQVLARLTGWDAREIPPIFGQMAEAGLSLQGSGTARPFGELVFASFAEIIKDPGKYPQAREAFYIAMDKLGRDIGRSTLEAVRGLDGRLDALVGDMDGLQVLRDGAIKYLDLMPGIAADTAATRADVAEILRIVSQGERVPLEILRTILREMGEAADGLDAWQIGERLKAKAAEFRSLTERLNSLSNPDPEVLRLRQAAAEALAKGQLAEVDAHLAAAEARDFAGLEDIEALARQKRLSAAESRAERGAAAKLRSNPDGYREAAAHYGEAARITMAADPHVARSYLFQQGQTLRELGDEFGLNGALMEAIAHFRAMLTTADRGTDPIGWAETQNMLGVALFTLGERESVTTRLEEAVTACRAALEERTRKRAPLAWAAVQNNLGVALLTLGEREGGTAKLEEAVSIFRAALEERTRERVPLDWATTQNNLGIALSRLGEREGGVVRLAAAAAAFRSALEFTTRERFPLAWAAVQSNLGVVLFWLGEREGGTVQLEAAAAAFRAALEVRTRERVPLDWAAAQNNLGNALWRLGEREGGTARLEEAVAIFRTALEERTRERTPLDWAMTQNDLGNALRTLGARESDTARLQEAVTAYRAALEERTRARVPFDWAATQSNLGAALQALGEQETGTARLEEAVIAYRAALEEHTAASAPLEWERIQGALKATLAEIEKRHGS